jgi:hypothetical protein
MRKTTILIGGSGQISERSNGKGARGHCLAGRHAYLQLVHVEEACLEVDHVVGLGQYRERGGKGKDKVFLLFQSRSSEILNSNLKYFVIFVFV